MKNNDPPILTIIATPIDSEAYTACYYAALRARGVRVIEGFSGRTLLAHRHHADYLHLHWLSFLYSAPSRLGTLLQFARFVALLLLARLLRIRLLWTAHNLYPHERSAIAGLDLLARKIVISLSYRVFAHGEAAALRLAREFSGVAHKLTLVPHGNWIGVHADDCTRDAARARLQIPAGQFVYLFFGRCREYKNLEYLTRCFQQCGADNEALWIVGGFQDPGYLARVKAQIERAPQRIRLVPHFVANDEIQYYLSACDVVVLPYAEILTSGGAMLAMGFGRPVVAPRLGHLQDVVNADCGVLYDVSDEAGLLRAMQQASRHRFDETVIRRQADSFRWSDAAQITLGALA